MIAHYLPHSALSHGQALTYLILTITLGGTYYDYIHFRNEEAEAYQG